MGPRNQVLNGGPDPPLSAMATIGGQICRPILAYYASALCIVHLSVHAEDECINCREGWREGDVAFCRTTLETGGIIVLFQGGVSE